jgi:murein DD-endopeptidase MepM/ murein hydrolase activator NlpD
MQKLWYGLGAAFSLCFSAYAAEIEVKPSTTLIQGQPFQVRIAVNESDPTPAQLTFGTQKIPLSQDEQGPFAFVSSAGDQKPGGYTLRILDAEGQVLTQQLIEIKAGSFYTQNIRYRAPVPNPEQKKILDQEEALVDKARSAWSPIALWGTQAFTVPVPHRISAVYGTRRYLNGTYNRYHSGVDFASPGGYPIKAPAAATVTLARYFSPFNSNGNIVFLDHGAGITSVYIHLSKLGVKEGEQVTAGQTIGYIGSTGRSTGPHLHWGLYVHGQNTDGLGWIKLTQALAKP